jgi:hypothetical protein
MLMNPRLLFFEAKSKALGLFFHEKAAMYSAVHMCEKMSYLFNLLLIFNLL